ncbi:hypothetical protein ACFSRY_05660 [Pontibacter locisalis]|uniref:Uncharacterized protein n=1 Tax=Pontibacter locisalis TaxID=1719035 RepID=A0ABW5IIY8_9BACT
MNKRTVQAYFWVTFLISLLALFLNGGLGLLVFGIVILAALIFHVIVGLKWKYSINKNYLITLSATNLLLFALVRVDGVHAFTDSGLSALLNLIGLSGGYSRRYEELFMWTSLLLFISQVVIDIALYRKNKQVRSVIN